MSEELTTTALKEEEFNKKVDMKVWKRLLAYGLRQKKLLIPLIVFMFIVAAIDLVYPQLSRYAIDSIIMILSGSFRSPQCILLSLRFNPSGL